MSDTHAQTVAFARDTMIEPQDPPLAESGVFKWVRENLFSGWLNILLTVISLYVIWWALSHVLPWAFNGIWNAGSLNECREIRDATLGPDAPAACWAVIAERWPQLIFGFYPPELYWRPILAFAVFLLAVMPVLFPELPRKTMWLSLAAPFLIFWLIWGGSVWGAVSVALGFVVGWAAFTFVGRAAGALIGTIAALLLPVAYWLFLDLPVKSVLDSIAPIALTPVETNDIGGFMLALIIGIAGITLSLPLGILLALGRQSNMLIINKTCVFFIEVIRGVPLIVWLFTASLLLNYFLPPGTNFDLMLRVIIMVTLFASAYIAEVVRGGLAALPRGQYEAADALGLDYWKSMRLVVLPQALKISIPGIVNTFIGLFKDTTLVVFIGLLFFVFCFTMGQYSLYLERKLRREHR
jgi:general L-amino acid transport system permease protein